jgi:hypothetical protein
VREIHRLASEGVDVVFDGIGGSNLWRSRQALCPGGTIVVYGFTAKLGGGRLASGHSGSRHRFREAAILGSYTRGEVGGLRQLLYAEKGRTLVFARTKHGTERLAKHLKGRFS